MKDVAVPVLERPVAPSGSVSSQDPQAGGKRLGRSTVILAKNGQGQYQRLLDRVGSVTARAGFTAIQQEGRTEKNRENNSGQGRTRQHSLRSR
ncbi:MAG: hypothetical protein K9N62_05615 [Verrucomicrobia bacterium]|nr:hypothetical protein [Verrucomicrobiota bacterium]